MIYRLDIWNGCNTLTTRTDNREALKEELREYCSGMTDERAEEILNQAAANPNRSHTIKERHNFESIDLLIKP